MSIKHRERNEEEVVMCRMCLLMISELLWSVRAERVYNKMLAADDCVGADSGSIGASVAISPENYFTPITGKIFQKWAWQWRCLANHCSNEFILFRQELNKHLLFKISILIFEKFIEYLHWMHFNSCPLVLTLVGVRGEIFHNQFAIKVGNNFIV